MELPFLVISYNRGPYLRNCVESILLHAPGSRITVIDDGSSDPEKMEILDGYSRELRVIRQKRSFGEKLGGLYRNMQMALDEHSREGPFVFAQDDCQVVRRLGSEDVEYVREYFGHLHDAAFLNPHFLKGIRRRGILKAIHFHADFPAYFYRFDERWKNRSVAMYYTDICIGSASRIAAKGFRFQSNETTTAIHARSLFGRMGTMVNAFVMSLPQVPIYRGKFKTRAVRTAERRLGTEPNAYSKWSEDRTRAFMERDPGVLPFAEDFLDCTGKPPRRPFVKKSFNAFPFLRLLHKLELARRGMRR